MNYRNSGAVALFPGDHRPPYVQPREKEKKKLFGRLRGGGVSKMIKTLSRTDTPDASIDETIAASQYGTSGSPRRNSMPDESAFHWENSNSTTEKKKKFWRQLFPRISNESVPDFHRSRSLDNSFYGKALDATPQGESSPPPMSRNTSLNKEEISVSPLVLQMPCSPVSSNRNTMLLDNDVLSLNEEVKTPNVEVDPPAGTSETRQTHSDDEFRASPTPLSRMKKMDDIFDCLDQPFAGSDSDSGSGTDHNCRSVSLSVQSSRSRLCIFASRPSEEVLPPQEEEEEAHPEPPQETPLFDSPSYQLLYHPVFPTRLPKLTTTDTNELETLHHEELDGRCFRPLYFGLSGFHARADQFTNNIYSASLPKLPTS